MPLSTPPDFQQLFEKSPGLYLVALPDADFTLVAVSDAYLRATMTTREGLLGRPFFEVFPGNPRNPSATGVRNLRASLERALAARSADTMAVQKYELRRPEAEGGGFQERHWSLVNTPVLSSEGEVLYLIHWVEDVTALVRARQQAEALAAEEVRAAEERLRLAIEALKLGTWDLNITTGTLSFDERMCALFGLPAHPLASVDYPTLLSRVHPDDRERLEQRTREAMAPGSRGEFAVECRIVPGEGQEERSIYLQGRVHLDASGRPIRFLGTGQDISERKRAAAQLARNTAILEAIIQSIPDALYVGDDTGIKQANTPALEMLGFQSLEDLNQNIALLGERLQNRSVSDGHRLAPEEEPFMQAFRGRPTVQEVRTRHLLTGKELVVRCAAAPVRVGDEIVGAVAVNTDVTELKQAEAELRQSAEFRERFIGIVSHDLRNPLNAILLSVNTLMRSDSVLQGHLKTVRRIAISAERMGRMISDLLDFTRGRLGGGIPINSRPANLRSICQQVLEEIEVGNPQRQLRLRTQGDGDFRGQWDADRLAQLLGNLGKNALDYSPEDSPVDFVLHDEGDTVCVEVHNRGSPIPANLLPHIFEPFRRSTSEGHPTSGLGLGLFIVQQIARAHRGHVEVRSTQAEGTTFAVRLPRAVLGEE